MRRVVFVPVLLVGLLRGAHAEPPATPRTEPRMRPESIRVLEAEVRAGPSSQYPVTGILHRGAQVWVKGDAANDFLKIDPPPGSVSWVPKAVVAPFGPLTGGRQAFRIVGGDDESIPVLPGSVESNGPLEVKDPELKITRGAQGYVRGAPVKPSWDIRQWVPIDPMPGESRFIAKAAIQDPPPGAAQTTASAKMPATDSSLSGLNGTELFKRAEQAERDGNIDVAIQLFNRVSAQESARNFDLANRAATRVFELSRNRPSQPGPGTLVSRSGNANAITGASPGASLRPNLPAAPTNNALRSSGVGWLRKTGFQIDDKPSFALIDANRRIMYYVTGDAGVNLAPYVERWVELFGVAEVRGDVRGADYLRVSRVMLVK
jgi:hypothetical protein